MQLLVADKNKKIYPVKDIEATGMKAGTFIRMRTKDFIKMPEGSELFVLPERYPVGYDVKNKCFSIFEYIPFSSKKEECFAVAAFVSPGFTVTHNASYVEGNKPEMLPLFSYAAVALYKNEFYVAAVNVDRELRQDLRCMNISKVQSNVVKLIKKFPKNRLIVHLKGCALVYGCPAAKNFFLQRYEAPLPSSPVCNAQCIGCISYQPHGKCSITQPRIKFIPTPEEIAEVALYHIKNVKDPVVSFGQGCEGEPLLMHKTIEKAITIIRKNTQKGIINLNTNASLPNELEKLFSAGLDSIRVSMNSVREEYYNLYYKPKSYFFSDVLDSIKIANKKNRFVSINYLTIPGFTDSKKEIRSFQNFLNLYKINMVQWRNLNFDPYCYFKNLKVSVKKDDMLGIKELIRSTHKNFPKMLKGYFNPSKLRIKRHTR